MSRPAKASYDDLARACAKLQVEGNLSVHTLRQALGGGGSDMLVRGLRQWRQEQREAVRLPLENTVSKGFRAAWTIELGRVLDEAAQEVHAMYADDRSHLDFCISEIRRLEKEVEHFESIAARANIAGKQGQAQAIADLRQATDRAIEHGRRADALAHRVDYLQGTDREKATEIAGLRQQRDLDAQALAQKNKAHASVQQAHQAGLASLAAQANETARLEERCLQQQDMLRYMRVDLETKSRDLEVSRAHGTELEAELRDMGQNAARAEAALKTMRQNIGARYLAKEFRFQAATFSPPRQHKR